MSVASLELCKELYELSEWDDTSYHYANGILEHGIDTAFKKYAIEEKYPGYCPAYDLSYLLRKLPKYVKVDERSSRLEFHPLAEDSTKWAVGYMKPGLLSSEWHIIAVADTPEDAACNLAIELFKQGILTKEAA